MTRAQHAAGYVPAFIGRAQSVSFLGGPDASPELVSPYIDLGQDPQTPPYDLAVPGAVAEIKVALVSLAAFHADPGKNPADPATEIAWHSINFDPAFVNDWDPATANEFALAVSRYRGLGIAVPGPYAQMSPSAYILPNPIIGQVSGPQPTATGLELLAGACNTLLGGGVKMALYEAWRGGTMPPDLGAGSALSGPKPETPVDPTYGFGPTVLFPPPQILAADAQLKAEVESAESQQRSGWAAAMVAPNEQQRAFWSIIVDNFRKARDSVVLEAIVRETRVRLGEDVPEADLYIAGDCERMGGIWDVAGRSCGTKPRVGADDDAARAGAPIAGMLVAGGAAAALLYYLRRRREARS